MQAVKKILKNTDWVFLIFLIIFLNQSNFSSKFLGVLFIYVCRPNIKFGLFKGKIPLFYFLVILLSVINFFVIRDFSRSYLAAFVLASILWVLCILSFHQINLFIEKGQEKIDNTLRVFTLINCLFSLCQVAVIAKITGKINPYRGLDFPYGLSTGDNIFGVLLQNSLLNVMICSMLVVYFVFKRSILFTLIALVPVILVFSNTGTVLLMGILMMMFIIGLITSVTKQQSRFSLFVRSIAPPGKSYLTVPILLAFIVGLSYMISPENIVYTAKSIWTKIHQGVSDKEAQKLVEIEKLSEEVKDPPQPVVQKTIDTVVKKSEYDIVVSEKENITKDYLYHFKGKSLSYTETAQFLTSSPTKLIFGAGPVRFSSLTAQRMSGFDASRIFTKYLPHFSSREYRENHMLLIKVRRDSTPEYWSSANWPDSFYNQILGEYGLLGFIIFVVFYIGFFAKKINKWSYGFWLSLLAVWFAVFSYLFETFSVIIIYELLMQLDIKQSNAEHVAASNGLNAGV